MKTISLNLNHFNCLSTGSSSQNKNPCFSLPILYHDNSPPFVNPESYTTVHQLNLKIFNYTIMKKSINFYKSDKKVRNGNSLFEGGKKIIASVLLCLFFSQVSFSQIDLTSCYGSCTSGDFTITKAYLSDINGVAITSAACSTPGTTVDAYLSFTFTNTTNSDRNGIFISGTINGSYIYKCFSGILPKKKSTTFTDVTHKITWTCGTDLTLTGTFTSWGSSSEQVCDMTCSQATPSKCRNVGDLVIQTPLSNNFTSSSSCGTGNNFATIAFTGTASGGDHNFTYSWNFGDGASSTLLSPTHTYASAGNFSVTFTVSDGSGTSQSVTKTVAVVACCTTPTITTNPSPQTKCAGSSASFTVASSGGSPAPTLQWQVSTNSGSTWTNLTNVAPYSGVTTTTLSLSTTTIGLNGNQYRCVLTSGICTPANSNAALLTVNGIPSAPGVNVVNNCDGSSDLTATTYSGALLWSNSATTATIHVTNATATTYTVTQTVSGCTSGSGSGTTAPKATPGKPSVSYVAPLCTETTFSVNVTSVVANATYSIVDKNGNTISGVLPDNTYTPTTNSSFSFTNIPAGSGFQVVVTNSGCPSSAANCGSPSGGRQTLTTTTKSATLPVQAITLEEPFTKVTAAPNPFNNRIKFSLQSAVSGQGSLELYDMLGQKLKTVFQGYVEKGQIKTLEYSVPGAQHSNLIYLFKVGNQRKTGILIGGK